MTLIIVMIKFESNGYIIIKTAVPIAGELVAVHVAANVLQVLWLIMCTIVVLTF